MESANPQQAYPNMTSNADADAAAVVVDAVDVSEDGDKGHYSSITAITSTGTGTTNRTTQIATTTLEPQGSSKESHYGPVIIHQSLRNSQLEEILTSHGLRVRVSSSVLEDTIIWPKARLAFLDLDLSVVCTSDLSRDLFHRLDRFMARHAHCYVILRSPLFTGDQFGLVTLLNAKYIGSKTDFLLAHHALDCFKAMVTIVALQVPPQSNRQHSRFCDVMTQLITLHS